jgi:hypothetical protein
LLPACSLLAPCLLVGRMLGPGRLVQFGPIGLDQSNRVYPAIVTQRDNRRQESRSRAAPQLAVAYGTQPLWQLDRHSHDGVSRGPRLRRAGGRSSRGQPRSRRSSKAPVRFILGPPEVHARYICTLTCKYLTCEKDAVPASGERREGGSHTSGDQGTPSHWAGAPSRRHGGTAGRTGRARPDADIVVAAAPMASPTQPVRRGIQPEFSCTHLSASRRTPARCC